MMTRTSLLLWAPRVVGVLVVLFLSVFALDAFDGRPPLDAVAGFVIHLAPALIVLAVVAVAWRLPLAGAVAFPILAVFYAVTVRWRLDWVAVIGGPLVVLGLLFLASWRANAAPSH
jgi:hypothetical protein